MVPRARVAQLPCPPPPGNYTYIIRATRQDPASGPRHGIPAHPTAGACVDRDRIWQLGEGRETTGRKTTSQDPGSTHINHGGRLAGPACSAVGRGPDHRRGALARVRRDAFLEGVEALQCGWGTAMRLFAGW